MIIEDKVYGTIELNEPLLEELIQSKPVQRMKGVMQGGAQVFIIPERNTTRYDHCVGVMLLLRKFNAPLEEQAAGLLHDIGHTAFSHVVDVLFREYNHNYDDAHLEQIIEQSEIPKIMEKYGLDWKKIIEKEKFPLLEQPSPALCADRIDYTLRDSLPYSTHDQRKTIIDNLTTRENVFVFQNKEGARAFFQLYADMDQKIWNSTLGKASYGILAHALRIALDEHTIAEKDLYLTDEAVMQKLRLSNNEKIRACVKMLNPKLKVAEDENAYTFTTIQKGKWIDPPFLINGQINRLSQLEPDVLKYIDERKKLHNHEMRFRVVSC